MHPAFSRQERMRGEGGGGEGNLIIPFREADNTSQGREVAGEVVKRIKRGKERYVSVWVMIHPLRGWIYRAT